MRLLPAFVSFLLVVASMAGCAHEPDPSLAAARLQVIAAQLPLIANDAAGGNVDAFATLKSMQARSSELRKRLALTATAAQTQPLEAVWTQLNSDINNLLQAKPTVLAATAAAGDFEAQAAVFGTRIEEATKILVEHGGSPAQILVSMRERLLLDRMVRRVQTILAGREEAQSAADGLLRDEQLFQVVLESLSKGNDDLNIKPIGNPAATQILRDVLQQWIVLEESVKPLLNAASPLQDMRQAADAVRSDGDLAVLKALALVRDPK